MLELLEERDDEHFEGFCQSLQATGQHGVVRRYLQEQRVRFIILALNASLTKGVIVYRVNDY